MSDSGSIGGSKGSTDSAEVQTQRNWWNGAKDFIVSHCPMFDMGDNTKLHISETQINTGNVFILDRLISSASHVGQEGTHGLSNDVNYQICWLTFSPSYDLRV